MKKVAKNYRLEDEKLRDEYSSFFNNHRKLRKAREESNPQPAAGESFDIKRENFHSVLQLMIKYNLQSALPRLLLLYKILVSLQIGSTNCERASSKLKIVSMEQDSFSSPTKVIGSEANRFPHCTASSDSHRMVISCVFFGLRIYRLIKKGSLLRALEVNGWIDFASPVCLRLGLSLPLGSSILLVFCSIYKLFLKFYFFGTC